AGIRSQICIAHVRHLTVGTATRANSHPFARELDGQDYCFAHNGTLGRAFTLPLGRFHPVGSTDSEHFFCHLLDEIAGWEKVLSDDKNLPKLHAKLRTCNEDGKLNMLLSDGKRLAAYHDAAGWKGLYLRRVVVRDQEKRCFEDPDLRVELGNGAVN